jgi:hypothetical protein
MNISAKQWKFALTAPGLLVLTPVLAPIIGQAAKTNTQ